MSLPASPRVTIDRNRYYPFTINAQVAGEPLDVSGYTWTAQIRPGASTDVIDMTVDATDAVDGLVVFSLDATDTAGLPDVVHLGVDVEIGGKLIQVVRSSGICSDPVEP